MQQMRWSLSQIKLCEKETGQAMLKDEHLLAPFTTDFGKLRTSQPKAVCVANSIETIQGVLHYANQHGLPITIRGGGLSQGGQSLAVKDGLILHLEKFKTIHDMTDNFIWVDGNASFASVLATTLPHLKIPYVLPYNCHLSIAGVLSAGGVGASSFRFGAVGAEVSALEIITAEGSIHQVEANSELFNACLAGQGHFAVISKVGIKLRPCLKNVRTFFLVYLDKNQWLHDLEALKDEVDFIEAFCSPSLQGAKLHEGKRLAFAQWLFALHVAKEYDKKPPTLSTFGQKPLPWKILHVQDESMQSYLHRHDSRFEAMKLTGQWELAHPWYECFISESLLLKHLDTLLMQLPLHYASIIQVVPMAKTSPRGFFMLPQGRKIYALMILNPGVLPVLTASCLQAIKDLDQLFLTKGGKRYLSGHLGMKLDNAYWQQHFGPYYPDWISFKEKYDPKHIFQSALHYF